MTKRDGVYLTSARLYEAIKEFSDPYPFRTGKNDIWLMGDAIQCAETERMGRIDRHVMVDEKLHEIVVEAYCPNWRIKDSDGALLFANKWNFEHNKAQLIVDMWRSRFLWRCVFDTRWVRNKEALGEFIENEYIDMETESSECFESAYREMHNMRPKADEPFEDEEAREADTPERDPKGPPPEQGEFAADPIT